MDDVFSFMFAVSVTYVSALPWREHWGAIVIAARRGAVLYKLARKQYFSHIHVVSYGCHPRVGGEHSTVEAA